MPARFSAPCQAARPIRTALAALRLLSRTVAAAPTCRAQVAAVFGAVARAVEGIGLGVQIRTFWFHDVSWGAAAPGLAPGQLIAFCDGRSAACALRWHAQRAVCCSGGPRGLAWRRA
jgi:hypothetical protein